MAKPLISVMVRNRTGVLWEGEATALSSWNKIGPFDVLPRHSNFVSTVQKKLRMHKPDGLVEELNVESGLIHVYADKVTVFLGVV